MEQLWQGLFSQYFSIYAPHRWSLLPVASEPITEADDGQLLRNVMCRSDASAPAAAAAAIPHTSIEVLMQVGVFTFKYVKCTIIYIY